MVILSIFLLLFASSEVLSLLSDRVTEFYDAADKPVHMIVSGSVLVTDETSRNTRSNIPSPSIHHHSRRDTEGGLGFVYNNANQAGDDAVYFFPQYILRNHHKKKHGIKKRIKHKRRYNQQYNKEVKGNVRNKIPKKQQIHTKKGAIRNKIPMEEEHVKATRKSIYPPPSNMWVINQVLSDTEETLRQTGKINKNDKKVNLDSIGQLLNLDSSSSDANQQSTKPSLHPEIETVDATTNFRTKERVPRIRNMHNKMPNPIITIPVEIPEQSPLTPQITTNELLRPSIEAAMIDDHETAAMFNKGHRLFKPKEDAQKDNPEGTKDYHEKINEIQDRVKLLKDNADDNKETETHVTQGGSHTVNGVPQKNNGNDGTHTINGVPQKELQSEATKDETDSSETQNGDQKQTFSINDEVKEFSSHGKDNQQKQQEAMLQPGNDDSSKVVHSPSQKQQDFASTLYNTLTSHTDRLLASHLPTSPVIDVKQEYAPTINSAVGDVKHAYAPTVNSAVSDVKQEYAPTINSAISDVKQEYAPTINTGVSNVKQEHAPTISTGANDEASYANTFQEKFLKLYSPEAFTGHTENSNSNQPQGTVSSQNEKENLKFGESSVKEGGILLHGEEAGNHFKPHIKALVIQTKPSTDNHEEAETKGTPFEQPKSESSPETQPQTSQEDEVENPAGYTPEQRTSSEQRKPSEQRTSSEQNNKEKEETKKVQHPKNKQSFKELLTQKIQENLKKINPKVTSSKAKQIAVEALKSPQQKTSSLHETQQLHPVMYPKPDFSEFVHKKLHEEQKDDDNKDNTSEASIDNKVNGVDDKQLKEQSNSHEVHMLSPHNKSNDDVSPNDGIDSKTEKPVSARKDPDEDQMTITADPTHEDVQHDQAEAEGYVMDSEKDKKATKTEKANLHNVTKHQEKQQEEEKPKPKATPVSNENIVNKQRATEYVMYKQGLNNQQQQPYTQSQPDQLATYTANAPTTSDTTGESHMQNQYQTYDATNPTSATDLSFVTNQQSSQYSEPTAVASTEQMSYENSAPKDILSTEQTQTQAASTNPSTTESKNIESTTATSNTGTTEDTSSTAPSNTNENTNSAVTNNYEESNTVGVVESDPVTEMIPNTPVDAALNANEITDNAPPNDGIAPVPELAISAPQDFTAKAVAGEPENFSVQLPELSSTENFVSPEVPQSVNDMTEHKEIESIDIKEQQVDSKQSSVNLAPLSAADLWPSGVNPGALMSFEMKPTQSAQNEVGTNRENTHNEQIVTEGMSDNQQALESLDKSNSSLNHSPTDAKEQKPNGPKTIMALLKPSRPTGPSIAYDQQLTGVVRDVYTSSKSKSKSKASASSSTSSDSKTSTATNYNYATDGKNKAGTQTVASTRHHEKKPRKDYGYGSGSGYGYGTKSWGWGGGGGSVGSPPPYGGIPNNIPMGPPPNLPGFPNGKQAPPNANQAPAATNGNQAPAATSGNQAPAATNGNQAPATTSGSQAPAATSGNQAPAATSGNQAPVENAPATAPMPNTAGASHTPQDTQTHQSSAAEGPSSVPPSYTNSKKPEAVKETGKFKNLKYRKPKIDKIKTTSVKISKGKQTKMKKIQKQITYENNKKLPVVNKVPVAQKHIELPNEPIKSQPGQSINIDVTPDDSEPEISKPVQIKKPYGPKSNFPNEDNDK